MFEIVAPDQAWARAVALSLEGVALTVVVATSRARAATAVPGRWRSPAGLRGGPSHGRTTAGFGDHTAATSLGHALAVVEMLTGQLYLVTVIGVLVGGLVGRHRGA